jgi:hypothetical protein
MEKNLIKQVNFLKIYAGILTLVCLMFFLVAFKQINNNPHFKEIDVERINIVEKSGKLKMVISNHESQHPGSMDGKSLQQRDRPAGIIFFNDEGDECGGLVYDGNKAGANMVYSIDQFKNDQIMQLQYNQETGKDQKVNRTYGLKLWDRPDNFTLSDLIKIDDSLKKLNNKTIYNAEIGKLKAKGLLGNERLFLGKTTQNEVGLFIRDEKGRPRIKVYIDSNNKAVLEALDDQGNPAEFNKK